MAKKELALILKFIAKFPSGAPLCDIMNALNNMVSKRTVQRHLSRYLKQGLLTSEGLARAKKL